MDYQAILQSLQDTEYVKYITFSAVTVSIDLSETLIIDRNRII